MYRATHTAEIKSESHPDLCFASKRNHAIGYLAAPNATTNDINGYLHTAVVTDWDRIASWDEAVSAWADAGMSTDEDAEACWYADRADRRDALAAAGFAGMIYDDVGPCNHYRHECVRVWDASVIDVTKREPCVYDADVRASL